jgi:hypothetical protein
MSYIDLKKELSMRKILQVFFAILSVSLAASQSYALVEGDTYRTSYACYDSKGGKRWQATAEIRHKQGNIYNITEKMNGIYTGFDRKISWIASTDFEKTKDTLKPLDMDQRIFDESGKPIAIRRQDFNYDNKTVTCTYEDLVNNTVSKREFVFTKNIINRLLQGIYGRKFIEDGKVSEELQVISPEPKLYNIRLWMVGKEDVEVGGQTRKAYKLCFDPMLGMFNFVKIFIPKSHVWHSDQPIYELLKYEGLESSVDSPDVEIISLEKELTTSLPEPKEPGS